MSTQKRRKVTKPKPISTDAALVTATLLTCFPEEAQGGEFVKSFMAPLTQSSQGTTVFSHERLEGVLEKQVTESCDKAAELLSRVLFAERLFKRLNLNDPKHIVTIIYCVLRLARTDSKEFQIVGDKAKSRFGKYWRWPTVWGFALEYEIVMKRRNEELARGEREFTRWRDEVQKFANNFWLEETKSFGNLVANKKLMIESLRSHPVISRILSSR